MRNHLDLVTYYTFLLYYSISIQLNLWIYNDSWKSVKTSKIPEELKVFEISMKLIYIWIEREGQFRENWYTEMTKHFKILHGDFVRIPLQKSRQQSLENKVHAINTCQHCLVGEVLRCHWRPEWSKSSSKCGWSKQSKGKSTNRGKSSWKRCLAWISSFSCRYRKLSRRDHRTTVPPSASRWLNPFCYC